MIQVSEETATFAWKKGCSVRKLLQTKVKSFVMTFFGLKLVAESVFTKKC